MAEILPYFRHGIGVEFQRTRSNGNPAVFLRVVAIRPVTLAVLAIVSAPAAHAFGEYEIVKTTADRVWRLDKRTGEISVCTLDPVQPVCIPAKEIAHRAVVVRRSFVHHGAARPWRPIIVAKPVHGAHKRKWKTK